MLIYKEPEPFENVIKDRKEIIKHFENELKNAKSYWYKLKMKIAIKEEKEYLQELLNVNKS